MSDRAKPYVAWDGANGVRVVATKSGAVVETRQRDAMGATIWRTDDRGYNQGATIAELASAVVLLEELRVALEAQLRIERAKIERLECVRVEAGQVWVHDDQDESERAPCRVIRIDRSGPTPRAIVRMPGLTQETSFHLSEDGRPLNPGWRLVSDGAESSS